MAKPLCLRQSTTFEFETNIVKGVAKQHTIRKGAGHYFQTETHHGK